MRLFNNVACAAVLGGTTLLLPAQLSPDLNVRIPVTVTDQDEHPVTGLMRENFQIFQNGKQQQINSVDSDDTPVSIGILVDLSGSMAPKLAGERYAILQFIKSANPRDEFFLVGFNEQPELIADFTSSEAEIEAGLADVHAGGRAALLDGIIFGLDKLKAAHNQRMVLLVISNGVDNRSHHSEGDVQAAIRKSDVEIISIGIFDVYAHTPEERAGPYLLSNISGESGGQLFRVDDLNDLSGAAETISTLLRHQYVIRYVPGDLTHDGKWRKVKVKVNPPPGLTPRSVYARSGYYAPSQ
jgi:Ca-activated chloride channel family protein